MLKVIWWFLFIGAIFLLGVCVAGVVICLSRGHFGNVVILAFNCFVNIVTLFLLTLIHKLI